MRLRDADQDRSPRRCAAPSSAMAMPFPGKLGASRRAGRDEGSLLRPWHPPRRRHRHGERGCRIMLWVAPAAAGRSRLRRRSSDAFDASNSFQPDDRTVVVSAFVPFPQGAGSAASSPSWCSRKDPGTLKAGETAVLPPGRGRRARSARGRCAAGDRHDAAQRHARGFPGHGHAPTSAGHRGRANRRAAAGCLPRARRRLSSAGYGSPTPTPSSNCWPRAVSGYHFFGRAAEESGAGSAARHDRG